DRGGEGLVCGGPPALGRAGARVLVFHPVRSLGRVAVPLASWAARRPAAIGRETTRTRQNARKMRTNEVPHSHHGNAGMSRSPDRLWRLCGACGSFAAKSG